MILYVHIYLDMIEVVMRLTLIPLFHYAHPFVKSGDFHQTLGLILIINKVSHAHENLVLKFNFWT